MTGSSGQQAAGLRWPDNRLVITGSVVGRPDSRQTPAGLKLVRVTLEHASAGPSKRPSFHVVVCFGGEPLASDAEDLKAGDRIRVTGALIPGGFKGLGKTLEIQASGLVRIPPATD